MARRDDLFVPQIQNVVFGTTSDSSLFNNENKEATRLFHILKKRGACHPKFTKALIQKQFREDAKNDIETTMYKVSLMCPVGKVRMKNPCRFTTCKHVRCFEAVLYLQMNENNPTWNCPVCNEHCKFKNLILDSYFGKICGRLPLDHSEIQLNQDGTWSRFPTVVSTVQAVKPAAPAVNLDYGEPEIIIVEGTVATKMKSVVVDLTLSDSDDDNSPDDVQRSSTTTTRTDTVIQSDSSSNVSTTGRRSVAKQRISLIEEMYGSNSSSYVSNANNMSVTSPRFMSPIVITIDSPSPPTTPPSAGTL